VNRRGFLWGLLGAPLATKLGLKPPLWESGVGASQINLVQEMRIPIAFYQPTASPLLALMEKLKQKNRVEGPAGDASFVCWEPMKTKKHYYEWLEK
jgi:hypothetical protein